MLLLTNTNLFAMRNPRSLLLEVTDALLGPHRFHLIRQLVRQALDEARQRCVPFIATATPVDEQCGRLYRGIWALLFQLLEECLRLHVLKIILILISFDNFNIL